MSFALHMSHSSCYSISVSQALFFYLYNTIFTIKSHLLLCMILIYFHFFYEIFIRITTPFKFSYHFFISFIICYTELINLFVDYIQIFYRCLILISSQRIFIFQCSYFVSIDFKASNILAYFIICLLINNYRISITIINFSFIRYRIYNMSNPTSSNICYKTCIINH